MPNPSGPNAYPSAPNNYPSGPNQWTAAATTHSTSSATVNGVHGHPGNVSTSSTSSSLASATVRAVAAAATTSSSSATSAGTVSITAATVSTSSATAGAIVTATVGATTSSTSTTNPAAAGFAAYAAAVTSSTSSSSAVGQSNTSGFTTSASSTSAAATLGAAGSASETSTSSSSAAARLTAAGTASSTSTSSTSVNPVGTGAVTATTTSTSTATATGGRNQAATAAASSASTATADGSANSTFAVTPVITDSRARIFCRSNGVGTPFYAGIVSAATYTLRGSQVSVGVPTVPAAGGATAAVQTALILTSASAPTGRRLVIAHRADLDVLQFRHEYDPAVTGSTAFNDPNLLQVTYSATEHRYWRIVHSGTQIIWETSPDNYNWTGQRTVTAPTWCSSHDFSVRLESWRTNGINDYAEFDAVNPLVVPPPPAPPALVVGPPGPVVPQTPLPQMRLLVADTITGRVGWELPLYSQAPTWATVLNDVGSFSATVAVEAALEAIYSQGANNPADALRETLDGPNRFTYVMAWGNTAVWAGPMQPSVSTTDNQPTITVAGSGIESLLDKRVVMGFGAGATGTWADPSRDVVFPQTNPASVIYQLVTQAITSHTAAPARGLPIFCSSPPDPHGDETFTYLSYDLNSTWKVMKDLAARVDGPDFRFVPILSTTSQGLLLSYDLQIGDPYLPGSGPPSRDGPLPWVFDDRTSIVQRAGDAVGTASMYFSSGSGQDRSKLIAQATSSYLTNLGFPAMEQVATSNSSETDPDKLDAYTQGLIAAHQTPTETWTVTALNNGAPPLGGVLAGDEITVDCRQHWLISPGSYTHRVTSVAGGNSSGGSAAGTTFDLICSPD